MCKQSNENMRKGFVNEFKFWATFFGVKQKKLCFLHFQVVEQFTRELAWFLFFLFLFMIIHLSIIYSLANSSLQQRRVQAKWVTCAPGASTKRHSTTQSYLQVI